MENLPRYLSVDMEILWDVLRLSGMTSVSALVAAFREKAQSRCQLLLIIFACKDMDCPIVCPVLKMLLLRGPSEGTVLTELVAAEKV